MASAVVKNFLDQGVEAPASSLSSLVTELKDPTSAYHLVVQQRPVCNSVIHNLVGIANGAHSAPVRLMALEGLFFVSNVPDDHFRQTDLFAVVQKLNESFSALLDREVDRLEMQREMLTVLLLRCTGYVRMKAGDILAQLCGSNESSFIAMLVSMIQNRQYERPIIQTCFRSLYELSTPISYFHAEENSKIETTKITAFQGKIHNLVAIFQQKKLFQTLFEHLSSQWTASVQDLRSGLGMLGSISAYPSAELSSVQKEELIHWGTIIRYVCVMIQNISNFCDAKELVKELQTSFMREHHNFLSTVLIPFVVASISTYTRSLVPGSRSDSTTPYMNAAVMALKFLRFAAYRSGATPSPSFIAGLMVLTQLITRQVKPLTQKHIGMLILIFTVEVLCNVNAVTIDAPYKLSEAYDELLTTISGDKTPVVPGVRYSLAQGFIICFSQEDSGICETNNSSTVLLHSKFEAEELALREDAEAFESVKRLEEQLELLQSDIMQLALGHLIREMSTMTELMLSNLFFGNLAPAEWKDDAPPQLPPPSIKEAKKKHPAEFCCQLTGKLMREPVVLKNGHHFELDALQAVIDEMGHIDPLSGEALNESIDVNAALQQQITQYKVDRATRS